MDSYHLKLIFSLSLMILLTRALPFLFAKQLQQSQRFQAVGKELPAYVMLLLVIYEIGPERFLQPPYGIPEVSALVILTFVHYISHQLFLSLMTGTISYVLLLQWMA